MKNNWFHFRQLKQKIVFKLAFASSLAIILVVAMLLIGQLLCLEKFFITYKVNQVKQAMGAFQTQRLTEKWNEAQTIKALNAFTAKNGLQAAVLDQNGLVKYRPNYDLVLKDEKGNLIHVSLGTAVFMNRFNELALRVGDEMTLKGAFNATTNQVYAIYEVEKQGKKWINENTADNTIMMTEVAAAPLEVALPVPAKGSLKKVQAAVSAPAGTSQMATIAPMETSDTYTVSLATAQAFEMKTFKGVVTQLTLPTDYDKLSPYEDMFLYTAIDRWHYLKLHQSETAKKPSTNELVEYSYQNPMTGLNSRILVIAYPSEGQSEYFFVNLPLSSIRDAVEAVKRYYLLGFAVVLMPIIFLAGVFSKWITRPLLAIHETAGRYERMDFSVACAVDSEDEIGSLAQRLNQMGQTLDRSLSELKAANEQLQRDIENEKKLEGMRKEFIASVSHEFKTPLGILKAYTEGLTQAKNDERRNQYANVLLHEIEKMDELVLDLLALSKLESGSAEPLWEDFSITELVDQVAMRFTPQLESLNVQCVQRVGTYTVRADFRMIEQVLTNFISNAIRHVNPSGRIVIGAAEVADGLKLVVGNTGSCIDEAEQEKIWDKFYRVEHSRDKRSGGTGLGLSIVKHLLKLHHSRFGVENTADGVEFYFTLMLVSKS